MRTRRWRRIGGLSPEIISELKISLATAVRLHGRGRGRRLRVRHSSLLTTKKFLARLTFAQGTRKVFSDSRSLEFDGRACGNDYVMVAIMMAMAEETVPAWQGAAILQWYGWRSSSPANI